MTSRSDYQQYSARRLHGEPHEALAGQFSDALLLQQRYVDAWNAGARLADDARCPGCSARGYVVLCMNCSRNDEANR